MIEVLTPEQVAALFLNQLQHLLVVDHVGLAEGDEMVGTLRRASRTCCGSGPWVVGGGDHEDRAPSIWAAPVIMF